MAMRQGMVLRWLGAGMATVMMAPGLAVCRAQQKGGGQGLQNLQGAAAVLQQQQLAMEQAKSFASAQVSGGTPNPRQTGGNPAFPSTGAEETSASLLDSARTRRNDERQRRLESDTQRLLGLANQLKNEVAASGAESMTPEMLRQMDEIEKLAKSVKDRMRN